MERKNILIMGAAGRDFHNFNTWFRDKEEYNVKAFTATQIPNIDGRKYPASLAGKLYPDGIMIYDEKDLTKLIKEMNIDEVYFSYSDVPYNYVMNKSAEVNAAGASFTLIGTKQTMLKSSKPVIAIVAVRTGSGKSQTSRKVVELLRAAGKKVVAVRHPMPYGDLEKQRVQRFGTLEDLKTHKCTIEEIEEYEPHVANGGVIYAGVDYGDILAQAEKEADVIIWDGGNNDFSFYKPDLTITVADPLRPGHESTYYPGNVNIRLADVVVINKIESAEPKNVLSVRNYIRSVNPKAVIIDGASPITVDNPEVIKGKRVLVVEDGPTLTHGEMEFGAGTVAAMNYGAAELVDPRPWTVKSITSTYEKYPKIGVLLPAMGYGDDQVKDLEDTINATDCDSVVIGTPIDLGRILKINKPSTRVGYDLQEIGGITLEKILKEKGLL
ncbi:MAG: cyclic 2,3-diphosphoglycerate synthase [Bacteroidetes bacterium]|nr:cyclic 2,3-diphosphoglycerate synthase [Bacteroidota bacterium]